MSKTYTVSQVEHEILGKYYQTYVGTVRALEHAVRGNFTDAYGCLNGAQQNLDNVKNRFPDISEKATSFEQILREARTALGMLEKKLKGEQD